MSRKSKRQSRRKSSPKSSQIEMRDIQSLDRDFSPDYSQTIRDLRRIATLAGSFFVVLIILSFFLR